MKRKNSKPQCSRIGAHSSATATPGYFAARHLGGHGIAIARGLPRAARPRSKVEPFAGSTISRGTPCLLVIEQPSEYCEAALLAARRYHRRWYSSAAHRGRSRTETEIGLRRRLALLGQRNEDLRRLLMSCRLKADTPCRSGGHEQGCRSKSSAAAPRRRAERVAGDRARNGGGTAPFRSRSRHVRSSSGPMFECAGQMVGHWRESIPRGVCEGWARAKPAHPAREQRFTIVTNGQDALGATSARN